MSLPRFALPALSTARVMDVEPLLGRLVIHWADAEHAAEVAPCDLRAQALLLLLLL